MHVRHYAGERCLLECVIKRHSSLTPGIPGPISQQYNARLHVAKTVRDFCPAQHMPLLPWLAYWSDMSPIEHLCDLIDRRLAGDSHPLQFQRTSSAYKQYRILFHKQTFKKSV
ncbi:hypothetical protein TNCV_703221 [Trichonephila clavipes]|nr:hypothetical protein TNCV_703221 [Trichonephila clavipes]